MDIHSIFGIFNIANSKILEVTKYRHLYMNPETKCQPTVMNLAA